MTGSIKTPSITYGGLLQFMKALNHKYEAISHVLINVVVHATIIYSVLRNFRALPSDQKVHLVSAQVIDFVNV